MLAQSIFIGRRAMRAFFAGLILTATTALADEPVLYPYDGSFEDANFAVESAIVNRGLVIDYVSHVGEMLDRTGGDVGSGAKIFESANIFLFCSAVISRKVMEADPMNVQHCPYGVFVTDRDGKVMIGHRDYPEGAMQDVQTLLSEIATEASDF
jgi:uncharacterized protein (DUF302 family)